VGTLSDGRTDTSALVQDGPLTLLHVSDRRYFFDDGGQWYTAKPLAFLGQLDAFPASVKRCIVFGRLLPLRAGPGGLSPVPPPLGIALEFRGIRREITGFVGFVRHLGVYYAALAKCLAEAQVVWAELSHVASILALLRRPAHAHMVAQLTVEPGDALALRGGVFWIALAGVSRWLNRRAMARADVCIFVSEYLQDRFSVPGGRGLVVHEQCVRQSDIVLAPGARPPGAPIVLYVGRLAPEKGVDILVRAIGIVTGQAAVRLRVVGMGNQRDRLVKLVRTLGLEACVEFVGPVAWGDGLFGEMRGARCLVLPSLSEGYPRVILEALSQGTPVIASAVGGIPEAVNHGSVGLLVTPGDPEELADAILRLVNDATLWGRLAEDGLTFARSNSLEAEVSRLGSVLSEWRGREMS
jgi:glycosyltransferase involved in cell wall biosynthesis